MRLSFLLKRWLVFSVTIIFTLNVVIQIPAFAQTTNNPPKKRVIGDKTKLTYEEALRRLDRGFKAIKLLESKIDKSRFDITLKTKALGRDVERIFYFVRDEIRYEPYLGVLRGAQGTLISGAGNSIDQSLLLSSMLKTAGYKIRFVTGRLSANNIDVLSEQFFNTNRAIEDLELPEKVLEEVASEAGIDPSQFSNFIDKIEEDIGDLEEGFWDDVEYDEAFIKSSLEMAGISMGKESRKSISSQIESNIYWVQYQGLNGQWINLEPVFKSSETGKATTKPNKIYEQIPEELFHRFQIKWTHRTLIEQRDKEGEEIIDNVLLGKVFKVPDLFAKSVKMMNLPDASRESVQKPVKNALTDLLKFTNKFVATLSFNGQVYSGKGFDMEGNVFEATKEAPFGPMSGDAMKDASEKIDGISNRISGEPEKKQKKPKGRILGQWIDFTLIPPQSASIKFNARQFRRYLIQPLRVEKWSPKSKQAWITSKPKNETIEQEDLIKLGIVLHAYADTFSHQFFSGLLSKVNDIDECKEVSGIPWDWRDKVTKFVRKIIPKEKFDKFFDSAMPAYGHGQAAVFPDLPYLTWQYNYDDSDEFFVTHKTLEVNNKKRFERAFQNIKNICEEYLEKHPQYRDETISFENFGDLFKTLLAEKHTRARIKDWKKLLVNEGLFEKKELYGQRKIFKKSSGDYDYDENKWLKEAFEDFDEKKFQHRKVEVNSVKPDFSNSCWYKYYQAVNWYKNRFFKYCKKLDLAIPH